MDGQQARERMLMDGPTALFLNSWHLCGNSNTAFRSNIGVISNHLRHWRKQSAVRAGRESAEVTDL
jgi:hypothetical protein